jgi:hypothetical protein
MRNITSTNKYCYRFSYYVRLCDEHSGVPFKKLYYVEGGEILSEEGLIQFTNNESVISYPLISFCEL